MMMAFVLMCGVCPAARPGTPPSAASAERILPEGATMISSPL